MHRFLAALAPHLSTSAAERAKQIPVRALLSALLAWTLYGLHLVAVIWAWLAVSLAVQIVEHVAMAPFRKGAPPASPWLVLPALASTVAMSAIYAGLAFMLWVSGQQVAATIGLLIIAGGLLNNVASGADSRPLFYIGAAPYVAALVAMPAHNLMAGSLATLPLLSVGIVLFIGAVHAVWSRGRKARLAEVRAREEAERRREEAETAMADRAAMAAIVSHELRTPVSAILAGAHAIRNAARAGDAASTAELIMDAGRLMTGMLNDLLDHSKMEAGRMSIEARDFDFAAFIDDTARFWETAAAEKGLTLRRPVLQGPVWLLGDPYRLRQIANNLLSNAVKFTPAGEIVLEADLADGLDGDVSLVLRVRDDGPGLPEDAMDRLFTPFAQASAEVARTYGGTGLGLTVSRELARLMGGELSAGNAPGGGAVFTLEVVLRAGRPVAAADPAAAIPVSARALRVLAVDDHEINRRTLELVLQPIGVDLTLASDGASGLELLRTRPFDVVLMDVNMPGMNGNDATRALRATPGPNQNVPVIGFSAGTEAAQVRACREAGMTDWLPKPLEPERLYEALARIDPRPEAPQDGARAA